MTDARVSWLQRTVQAVLPVEAIGEFPQIRALNLGPKIIRSIRRTPRKRDPQFIETAMWVFGPVQTGPRGSDVNGFVFGWEGILQRLESNMVWSLRHCMPQ